MIKASLYILIGTMAAANTKILRNSALMSKMVSNFRKDADESAPDKAEPVLHRMQSLLCQNFPSIPCEMITQDETLRQLIEKSIQQIKYQKLRLEKSTRSQSHLALFPLVGGGRHRHQRRPAAQGMHDGSKLSPRKLKFKDKDTAFAESGEKVSMSVEQPNAAQARRRGATGLQREEPLWRIDYMKHEEPGGLVLGYEDRLKDKVLKGDGETGRSELYIHRNKFTKQAHA